MFIETVFVPAPASACMKTLLFCCDVGGCEDELEVTLSSFAEEDSSLASPRRLLDLSSCSFCWGVFVKAAARLDSFDFEFGVVPVGDPRGRGIFSWVGF